MTKTAASRSGMTMAMTWIGFIAFTISFPFIVSVIGFATGCQATGGACGAVALVAGAYLKPPAYLAFVAILSVTVGIRLARLRFNPAWALLFGIAMLPDLPFATAAGAHWSVAFSLGLLVLTAPFNLIAALATCVFLSVVDGDNPRLRMPMAWIVALSAFAILATPALSLLLALQPISGAARPLYALLAMAGLMRPVALVALLAVYGYVWSGGRRTADSPA